MTDLGIGGIGPQPSDAAQREKLRAAAHQFEGLFLAQLFREMRASVEATAADSGPGQEMFSGMFDETMAMEAGKHSTNGIGEALYRQLAARLDRINPNDGPRS